MSNPKMRTYATVLVLVVAACQPAIQPTDPAEIQQQYDAYNRAFNAQDVNATAAFYTSDAVRMPNDGTTQTGTAIRDSLASFWQLNTYAADTVSAPEIQVAGDLAVTFSTFTEHWTPRAGGATTRQTGRWLLVWRHQSDGSWKISKEMWTVQRVL